MNEPQTLEEFLKPYEDDIARLTAQVATLESENNRLANIIAENDVMYAKTIATAASTERERIAQIFDGIGLRPYAEIVRDSNLTKKEM